MSSAFARPKSSTFTVPSDADLIFAGFRSRWMIPRSCAASSASAICLRDRQRLIERDRAAGDALARSSPSTSSITSAYRRPPAVFEPVDTGNVRMVEGREHFGFALKPREPFGVSGDRRRQNLDRDLAFQLRVGRPIDLAHATRADGGNDFVRAKTGAGSEGKTAGSIAVSDTGDVRRLSLAVVVGHSVRSQRMAGPGRLTNPMDNPAGAIRYAIRQFRLSPFSPPRPS